jgi:hypothetical protein
MVSLEGLVSVIVYLIVLGLICGLLWWLIDYVGLPEPFHRVAKVLIAVLAVVVVIFLLLGIVSGRPLFR